jgi:serine O-acetyltransferase
MKQQNISVPTPAMNTEIKNFCDSVWTRLCCEAKNAAEHEPVLRELLHNSILDCNTLAEALSYRISRKLGHHAISEPYLHDLFVDVLSSGDELIYQACRDIVAVNERDAACDSYLAPFLYFKGFQALTAYRVAHRLWNNERREIALYLQSIISQVYTLDIHPAARIGCGILIDHGTSIVIGETAVVEDDVSMLHEVTLGGTGKECGDRHPKVRKGVLIGSGAKILGNIEIGEGARIGAGSVVLNSVPPHSTVVGVPAKVVGIERQVPAFDMDHARCALTEIEHIEGLDFSI